MSEMIFFPYGALKILDCEKYSMEKQIVHVSLQNGKSQT